MKQTWKTKQKLTINELVLKGERILSAYQKQDAKIDARLLAMYLLNWDRTTLLLNAKEKVADHIEESYMYLIAKRGQGIPLQYITKQQAFMGLNFYVDERVLIPRQDTETLVETLINKAKDIPIHKAIEIGVGSGCISVALAKSLVDLYITAIDICEEALHVAEKNCIYNKVQDRVTLLQSNIFENYEGEEASIDLIVSNPPYISIEECKELMVEVRRFEPRKALTDEGDGLGFYKIITEKASYYLRAGGVLAYEIGYNQANGVVGLFESNGFKDIEVIQDLAHKDRVVIGRK